MRMGMGVAVFMVMVVRVFVVMMVILIVRVMRVAMPRMGLLVFMMRSAHPCAMFSRQSTSTISTHSVYLH